MTDLLKTLTGWLSQGMPVAVATIVTNEGSTPRTAGAKLLARPDGTMAGTVGGGLVEAQVLQAAARTLESGASELLDFNLTGELAAGADMICGGRLRVFLERVLPGPEAALFDRLEALLSGGRACLLATPLDGGRRALLTLHGEQAPSGLPPDVEQGLREAARDIQAPMIHEAADGVRRLLEPFIPRPLLVVAGGGHVSLPTSRIAAMVGFRVAVLDDRPEFANPERFPWAALARAVPMERCLDGLDIGPDASVAIVTRGHVHDALVLSLALRTSAGYVGMIGSRRKRDAVYDKLRKEGFTETDLARVRCPIGLDIGAQTPEEIAVSIVAELIQSRAVRQGLPL
ncbi:putative xanthine dehydrogenase subunit A [Fundidesulfovibrio magnetotacticus]|uniref:Putative xanthine dehydrogenase subunit A n=1 Tax=Fundidesulfovibrio magnetotacticus TaxID=2730080 RepID=A0A6V8LPC3_9BACT|nr:XdhC/CoxI family protein [Fundidesulfovibrio magnetotacticus]GFK92188.1 putative xanthine dehydrogenase subunit A [Fundidesulfovibrio magnetotacticus]